MYYVKGLPEVERKWYWVWYEDRKHAEDEKKWHYPDGFLRCQWENAESKLLCIHTWWFV